MPVVMQTDDRKKCHIIGNWKMHGSKQHVHEFFTKLTEEKEVSWTQSVHAAICPPFVYLSDVAQAIKGLSWLSLGAQDVSEFANGAYTGQVSAEMLVDAHCRYVIVGHSERRQFCHDSDEIVAKKFLAAKRAGLTPILCVGETLEQREQNKTESVILSQIQTLLSTEGIQAFSGAMIAYEPIWAIGTGKTATTEQAQAVHHLLRATLAEYDATLARSLPILYGGSVKPSNAKALFEMPDIDGALVGGASLLASDFMALCEAGATRTIEAKG